MLIFLFFGVNSTFLRSLRLCISGYSKGIWILNIPYFVYKSNDYVERSNEWIIIVLSFAKRDKILLILTADYWLILDSIIYIFLPPMKITGRKLPTSITFSDLTLISGQWIFSIQILYLCSIILFSSLSPPENQRRNCFFFIFGCPLKTSTWLLERNCVAMMVTV